MGKDHLYQIIKTIDLGALNFNSFLSQLFFYKNQMESIIQN